MLTKPLFTQMYLKKSNFRRTNKHLGNTGLMYPHDLAPKIYHSQITPILNYDETFHKNMKIFLTIIQVFSLMPVNGIRGPTAASLHYSFRSVRSFYSLLVIASNLTLATIICYFNITTGSSFDKIFPVIWFTANPFVMYQFIRMARKWPSLMQHWETIEMTTTQRDPKVHKQTRRIILAISVGIPTLGAIEHIFSLGNNVNTASLCKTTPGTLRAYFISAFPAYFYFFKVNYLNGLTLQLVNLYSTIAWSMTDTFIILVCLGLVTQFRHFNKNFERFEGMHLTSEFWGKQRIYFTKLTELLNQVNADLGVMVFTSFTVNTFYICVQLFESTTPSTSVMRRLYFWYSLLYLIGKTFLVSFIAMIINDEAKKPISILKSIPTAVYRPEGERFMKDLTSETIALSGMHFFYVTRSFLISMVGTIVTYEIILMQFQTRRDTGYDPCAG